MTQRIPFQSLLKQTSGGYELFDKLTRPHDDLQLSVQAHDGSYCCPRQGGLPPSVYTEFELAAFTVANDRIDVWMQPTDDTLREAWCPYDDVAAYVPTETVQAIVEYFLSGGEFAPRERKSWADCMDDDDDDSDDVELTSEAQSWAAFAEG
jgi:hypothetical protein